MHSMTYQLSETPTLASIDAHREWCRFLFENSDLNDMDGETLPCVWGWPTDAADLANARAFVYGCTKESTATLFWGKLFRVYRWYLSREFLNLDIFAINDDTSYLLNYGSFDDRTKFEYLALAYVRSAMRGLQYSASSMRILGELVAGAIGLGYDLHDSADGISPLLRLLHDGDRGMPADLMEARLHAWLALLKSTGVDLQIYGQEEWNRFQMLRRDCERPWDYRHGVEAHRCEEVSEGTFDKSESLPTLTAFTYGEDISDWKLWLLHPGDEYARQFWNLIEQNGIYCRHVPGGWVEEGW
jgi:hypothetical protein